MTLEARKVRCFMGNATKLADVLNIQGNPFVKEDMHNLVTFAVMPDYFNNDIENRDQLGRNKTVEFWDPHTKI